MAMGIDSTAAFSSSTAAMGNVGPGFGTGNMLGAYSAIPDAGKWLLSFNMLIGRLEIYGLILIFFIWKWK